MTDFGDDAGQMLGSQSERIASEVLRAMLGKARGKRSEAHGAADPAFTEDCVRAMSGIEFDPDDPGNISLDFETVEWDRAARIMADRFEEAGIPYAMRDVAEGTVRFTLHPASARYVKSIADGYIDSADERLANFTAGRFPNYGVLTGSPLPAVRAEGAAAAVEPQSADAKIAFGYRPYDRDDHAAGFRGELDSKGIPYAETLVSAPESVLGEERRYEFDVRDAPAVRRIADDLRRRHDPKGECPVERRFPDYRALLDAMRIPSEASAEERDVVRFAVPDREAAKLVEEGFAQEGIAYETYAEAGGGTVFVMFDRELHAKAPEIERVERKIGGGEARQSAARAAAGRERARSAHAAQPRQTFDADRKGARKYEYVKQAAPEEAARRARESAKARNAHQAQTAGAKVQGR